MILVVIGPQGSGKGTQAQLLATKLNLRHFEMGRILRSIAESDNKNAQMVREIQHQGGLVPDEFVRLVAWDFITKHKDGPGIIFEGYPRGVMQYEHLRDMLVRVGKKIDRVILIEISEVETMRRLTSRRTCMKCGEVYNTVTNPAKKSDVCDKCGGVLGQRDDDKPDAIRERLKNYRKQTEPEFEIALKEGIGLKVDGERPIEVIHREIMERIKNG